MIRYLLVLIIPMLLSAEIHMTLQSVDNDANSATAKSSKLQAGVSGFIVRHFNNEHSAIIANTVVTNYDEKSEIATLSFSEYTGLRQNSLPNGQWTPTIGDEAIVAYSYSRGVLLAPDETIWRKITSKVRVIDWIHPDNFATYLSFVGHPTPIKEDINGFCTLSNAGLLYVYAQQSLFTLDCQSLTLLQITEATFKYEQASLPFYSRVEEIRSAWWGEGSNEIEAYEPYYFGLMVEYNPTSRKLYDYIKMNIETNKELLNKFKIEDKK